MDLADLLKENVVKVPMEAIDKEEAIAELVEVLVRAGQVENREGVLEALYEREQKGTTGIGKGVAVPHARHPDVSGAIAAAGVSREGIEFDAVDEKEVRLVFLVLAEVEDPAPNVELLADIGYLVQVPGVYGKLVNANDDEEFVSVIEGVELES